MGSFAVSFLLAPLASNAAELVAAYKSSLKKTKASISLSLATLQVCACACACGRQTCWRSALLNDAMTSRFIKLLCVATGLLCL